MSAVSAKTVKDYVFLHICILIYTATSVLSKYASRFDFLSGRYIACLGLIVFVLGIYAIVWQQAIKNFKPSVAYSNKSVTTVWTLFTSALLFGEGITPNNILGAVLIIWGVILVAQSE